MTAAPFTASLRFQGRGSTSLHTSLGGRAAELILTKRTPWFVLKVREDFGGVASRNLSCPETKMSAYMVKEHGQGKTMGGIISKTTTGVDMPVHMKRLDRLISNTTGVPRGSTMMEGVLASTIPAHMKSVPELHKVPAREVGKTDSKMAVGTPYSGSKSGYGMASKKHSK